jgi:N-methylhydantoinase B/oxoprolinase/acetone carboxylase alpha subunit
VIIRGGGMGGSNRRDGESVYIFPANGANTPVEIFESDTPLLVERRELLVDSCGPGRNKGGMGRREVYRIPDDAYAPQPPVNLGIQSGRFRYAPEGLAGGLPGSKAQFLVGGAQGNPYGLTQLKPGDVVLMDAAGGGGYGEPLERDAALVAEDVLDGYVSIESARKHYGVVIDPASGKLDLPATEAERSRATPRPSTCTDRATRRSAAGRRPSRPATAGARQLAASASPSRGRSASGLRDDRQRTRGAGGSWR